MNVSGTEVTGVADPMVMMTVLASIFIIGGIAYGIYLLFGGK